jgi:hypothetical protein
VGWSNGQASLHSSEHALQAGTDSINNCMDLDNTTKTRINYECDQPWVTGGPQRPSDWMRWATPQGQRRLASDNTVSDGF